MSTMFKVLLTIKILVLCVSIFWSWRQTDKRNVEIVAYRLCFAALPSYTYCETGSCFDRQQAVTYYAITYVFDEYLTFCFGMTQMDRLVVSLHTYDIDWALWDIWRSFVECMLSNAGDPDKVEDFPYYSECKSIYTEVKKLGRAVADKADTLEFSSKWDTFQ